jgi:hypothetical protein
MCGDDIHGRDTGCELRANPADRTVDAPVDTAESGARFVIRSSATMILTRSTGSDGFRHRDTGDHTEIGSLETVRGGKAVKPESRRHGAGS